MTRSLIVRRILVALILGLCCVAFGPGQAADNPAKPGESLAARQKPLFDRLNLEEAWRITKGDPKVVVGVIDNSFDFFHPDLKGQLTPGYYYLGGYHTEFYEGIAHGTLVASLMVAPGDRPGGMVGLAPRCKVLTASQGMLEHTLDREGRFTEVLTPSALADKTGLKDPFIPYMPAL